MKHYNKTLLAQIGAMNLPQQPVAPQEFNRVLTLATAHCSTPPQAESAVQTGAAQSARGTHAAHSSHSVHGAARKKRTLLRVLRGTAIGVAACCALLVGTNFVSPVFAESLPLVGSIFAYFNNFSGKSAPAYVNEAVASMATDVVVDSANSASGSGSATTGSNGVMQQPVADITIEQAVCDGMLLQLSLRMQVKDDALTGAKSIWSLSSPDGVTGTALYPQYELRVNGKKLTEEYPCNWFTPVPDAPGEFVAILAYRVETIWQGDTFPDALDVSFLAHGLVFENVALDANTLMEKHYTERTGVLGNTCTMATGEWSSAFSVPTDASKTRMLPINETQGQVTLNSVLIGPSSMIVTATYPTEWQHVTLKMPVDDAGNKIQWHAAQAGPQQADGNSTWVYISSVPLPSAKSINFTVYDKNTDKEKATFAVALS